MLLEVRVSGLPVVEGLRCLAQGYELGIPAFGGLGLGWIGFKVSIPEGTPRKKRTYCCKAAQSVCPSLEDP